MAEGIPYDAPRLAPPYRVLVLAAATRGWYDASAQERSERILPRFAAWLRRWEEAGAELLMSFDDDVFMAGEPESGHSIYLGYSVPSLDVVVSLMQEVRDEVDGVRLDRYLRFDARIGRPLFLARDAA